MKKIISVIIAVITALCAASPAFSEDAKDKTADFIPVIRFIASSDTHMRGENEVFNPRLGMALEATYALADADENYNSLDAVIVAGDLTHDGTKAQFDAFKKELDSSLRDETESLCVVAKNHDGYEMKRAEM